MHSAVAVGRPVPRGAPPPASPPRGAARRWTWRRRPRRRTSCCCSRGPSRGEDSAAAARQGPWPSRTPLHSSPRLDTGRGICRALGLHSHSCVRWLDVSQPIPTPVARSSGLDGVWSPPALWHLRETGSPSLLLLPCFFFFCVHVCPKHEPFRRPTSHFRFFVFLCTIAHTRGQGRGL